VKNGVCHHEHHPMLHLAARGDKHLKLLNAHAQRCRGKSALCFLKYSWRDEAGLQVNLNGVRC
jgi:hypothetical protein